MFNTRDKVEHKFNCFRFGKGTVSSQPNYARLGDLRGDAVWDDDPWQRTDESLAGLFFWIVNGSCWSVSEKKKNIFVGCSPILCSPCPWASPPRGSWSRAPSPRRSSQPTPSQSTRWDESYFCSNGKLLNSKLCRRSPRSSTEWRSSRPAPGRERRSPRGTRRERRSTLSWAIISGLFSNELSNMLSSNQRLDFSQSLCVAGWRGQEARDRGVHCANHEEQEAAATQPAGHWGQWTSAKPGTHFFAAEMVQRDDLYLGWWDEQISWKNCENLSECLTFKVVEQLNKRFQPSPLIIKKRIEVGFQYLVTCTHVFLGPDREGVHEEVRPRQEAVHLLGLDWTFLPPLCNLVSRDPAQNVPQQKWKLPAAEVSASKEIFFSEQEAPSEQTFSTTHFCLFYVALSLVMNHGVLVLTHQRFMWDHIVSSAVCRGHDDDSTCMTSCQKLVWRWS